MPGKALLVGAGLDGLSGVENDVDSMQGALEARGFTVRRCLGQDSTRAGILAAYEQLIADIEPEEAAVVYYSGHGGLVQPPDSGSPGPELMDLQFIVPVDYHDSAPDDFRGITSVELSVLLARLTEKTRNATVVLDCCHATHMSRDRSLRVKAVPRLAPYDRLRAHIDKLRREDGLRTGLLRSTGNPYAVRIAACAPDQSAFEYTGDDGKQVGMLTEALTLALAQAGSQKITWATVLDQVRRRVLDLAPGQRPDVEGPSRRLLFDTAEDDLLTTLPVSTVDEGRVRLECAPLLGVRPGDAFMVMPPEAVAADAATRVGDLQVDRVGPLAAEGPVVLRPGYTQVPLGSRAHRTAVAAPAIPVRLPDGDPRVKELAVAVEAAPMLRVADPDERWLAAVEVDASGQLTVEDRIGPLHAPRRGDAAGAALVVKDLKVLAQAAALRGLTGDDRWALNAGAAVEWGVVREHARHPLPNSGAAASVGDRIYVDVTNGSAAEVFVSLVDVGVSGRITVLTRYSPGGDRLAPGKRFTLGFDGLDGVLTGVRLSWPDGLARQPRPETVLVLVTSAPQDLEALEQSGVHRHVPPPSSPLENMLDQIATGRTRDVEVVSGPIVRYDVHAVDFELDPLVEPDAA